MGQSDKKYTSKQMGDACEMLVAAELTLAGIPALKAPDNWPSYDVIAQPINGKAQRISVKSRTFKKGAALLKYKVTDKFDWLAIVILSTGSEDRRRFFIVPKKFADKKARKNAANTKSANDRYLRITDAMEVFKMFEDNFSLLKFNELKKIKTP